MGWRQWWLSGVFLLTYVAVFHFWRLVPTSAAIIASGIVAGVCLTVLLVIGKRQNYFVSTVEIFGHLVVIGDLAAEARLTAYLHQPGNHPEYSFYWCAIAFAVVIGGYRAFRLRRRARQTPVGDR